MNSLQTRIKKLKNRKGFTLVELIVVIVIIGILAAILIPRLTGFTNKAKATEAVVWAKEVATAFDSYYAENNAYHDTAAAETYVENLSGVTTGAFSLETDGGLLVTGTDGQQAGRASSGAAVKAGTH